MPLLGGTPAQSKPLILWGNLDCRKSLRSIRRTPRVAILLHPQYQICCTTWVSKRWSKLLPRGRLVTVRKRASLADSATISNSYILVAAPSRVRLAADGRGAVGLGWMELNACSRHTFCVQLSVMDKGET
jgi:hypothetical protein